MKTTTSETSENVDLQAQVEESRSQLNVLKNLLNNLYVENSSGNKQLRPNVKEKDIQLLSEAIVKIRSNYKQITEELSIMQKRESKLQTNHSKTRNSFMEFSKKYGVKIPKLFKDFYDIDG